MKLNFSGNDSGFFLSHFDTQKIFWLSFFGGWWIKYNNKYIFIQPQRLKICSNESKNHTASKNSTQFLTPIIINQKHVNLSIFRTPPKRKFWSKPIKSIQKITGSSTCDRKKWQYILSMQSHDIQPCTWIYICKVICQCVCSFYMSYLFLIDVKFFQWCHEKFLGKSWGVYKGMWSFSVVRIF